MTSSQTTKNIYYIMEREHIGAAVLAFVAGVVSVGEFILASNYSTKYAEIFG